jgi:hypothetical protein
VAPGQLNGCVSSGEVACADSGRVSSHSPRRGTWVSSWLGTHYPPPSFQFQTPKPAWPARSAEDRKPKRRAGRVYIFSSNFLPTVFSGKVRAEQINHIWFCSCASSCWSSIRAGGRLWPARIYGDGGLAIGISKTERNNLHYFSFPFQICSAGGAVSQMGKLNSKDGRVRVIEQVGQEI